MPQVLTANRLTKGEVVYWSSRQGWVLTLAEADLFEGQAGEDALKAAAESVRNRIVVNPYLFEARLQDGVRHPVKMREQIRAAGPTVRRDMGKQAVKAN